MRILIVDTYYPAFVAEHYAARPGLERDSYAAQRRSLLDACFGTADSYSHYLRALGHEAEEVIANCPPLQAAWAAERLAPARRLMHRVWRLPRGQEIVVEQVRELRPDVVYVQDMWLLSPAALRRIRASTRLLAGQIAHELPHPDQLAAYDVVYTSFPHYVPLLRSRGVASDYLRLAFDPRVLERLGPVEARDEIVFVGSLGPAQHTRGNGILLEAAQRLPVAFWGIGAEGWPPDSPIRRGYRGQAWGLDMYRRLAGARVVLNRHIDAAAGHANNMRLYEATGVGALLVTDVGSNLAQLFEPGREVVTYADGDELVARVRALLADEAARAEIAAAGQRRTLREHTWAVRMRELAELLSARLEERA